MLRIIRGSVEYASKLILYSVLLDEEMVALIIALGQILYGIFVTDSTPVKYSSYIIRKKTVLDGMPEDLKDMARDVLDCRNIVCHTIGTEECNEVLHLFHSRYKELRVFVVDLLALVPKV